jgi:hypothetical protein
MMDNITQHPPAMLNVDYLTDLNGQPKGVVIPIDLWRKIFPQTETPQNAEDLTDAIEDYCLHQAMNEAAATPLLDRQAALAYLEDLPE